MTVLLFLLLTTIAIYGHIVAIAELILRASPYSEFYIISRIRDDPWLFPISNFRYMRYHRAKYRLPKTSNDYSDIIEKYIAISTGDHIEIFFRNKKEEVQFNIKYNHLLRILEGTKNHKSTTRIN